MDIQEAKELNGKFTEIVPGYTDVFVPLSEPVGGKSEARAFGSCVHLTYKGHDLTVTCDHVAKEDCIYFTNPKGLLTPSVPEGEHPTTPGVHLLDRSKPLDLALFSSDALAMEQHGKTRYDLAKSAVVTRELLADPKHKGLASFIYGVWGKQTSGFVYPDGLAYMQVITYSGLGPIHEVTEDLIVTDHAEKEDLREGEPTLKQIEDIEITGGYRDIKGCSGSGLWIMADGPVLAGILCRPREAPADQHLIEFTPVWQVLAFIDSTLAE